MCVPARNEIFNKIKTDDIEQGILYTEKFGVKVSYLLRESSGKHFSVLLSQRHWDLQDQMTTE